MLKIPSFSIFIFLCVTLSTNRIVAADPYSNALKIFSEGNFFAASIEFERTIFYESDINKISQCKYYKALCYKGLGETRKALDVLNEINMTRLPDSLFYMIRYEQAFCNFLNSDVNQAMWNLEDIRTRIPDSLRTINIIPLNILCLNALNKWKEALRLWNYFIDHSSLKDSDIVAIKIELNQLYSKKNIPKFRSPRKAEILSQFIPGSGQIYAGKFFEGSLNFIMNAGLLGFSLYEFYTKFYITGYMVGLTSLNKVYHSGMHRANILATETNKIAMNKFNIRSTSLMMKIMDSKPYPKILNRRSLFIE